MSRRRGDSLPTVWPRPAHTKAKHDILVKYLQAWFAIMGGSRYDQKVGVFDGFAGPGLYDDGEPRIAGARGRRAAWPRLLLSLDGYRVHLLVQRGRSRPLRLAGEGR